jgi:hypothetical protein
VEFDSQERQEIFLHFKVSRPALGPTQPPVKCVPVVLSLSGKGDGA